jgi:hypothetical protein
LNPSLLHPPYALGVPSISFSYILSF